MPLQLDKKLANSRNAQWTSNAKDTNNNDTINTEIQNTQHIERARLESSQLRIPVGACAWIALDSSTQWSSHSSYCVHWPLQLLQTFPLNVTSLRCWKKCLCIRATIKHLLCNDMYKPETVTTDWCADNINAMVFYCWACWLPWHFVLAVYAV